MRKVALFLIIVLFASCANPTIGPFPDEISSLSSPSEIKRWIYDNLRYETDLDGEGKLDYWKTPEHTLADGAGHCEDAAILFLAICRSNLHREGYLFGAEQPDGSYHAWAWIDEFHFNEMRGGVVKWTYTLDQALTRAK